MAFTELERLYMDYKENKRCYLDNKAILDIARVEDGNYFIPEGMYNHLFRINNILVDRNSELRTKINQKIDEDGHPVIINLSIPYSSLTDHMNTISLKIGIPSNIDSVNLQDIIKQAIEKHIFPIIEKYKKEHIEQSKLERKGEK